MTTATVPARGPGGSSITRVGILGGGNMGKQVALLFALHGLDVVVWNHVFRRSFAADMKRVGTMQARLGHFDRGALPGILERIAYVDDMSALTPCELLIEAVPERLDVKREVLTRLAVHAGEQCIIATNTSTLSITELGACSGRPAAFLGVHFFNPPVPFKLVEVVRGELTSDATVAAALGLLRAMGKHPVVLPETPGFIVNRLLFPMINEAVFLLSEGIADAKTIDGCMKLGANHPMGPLELADFIGLDVCLEILSTLVFETGDGKYRPAPLLRKYTRAGKLGRKSGEGFYHYRTRPAEEAGSGG